MFPQIAPKRKKGLLVASQKVQREWEGIEKELNQRARVAARRVPPPVLNQFIKVCRAKYVPEFYSNYFLASLPRSNQQAAAELLEKQMEAILTQKSHYHTVGQVLKQRQNILESFRQALAIAEGFMLMAQGKSLPLSTKSTIDELVEKCDSLEQLRELERSRMEELAKGIIQLRVNSVAMIEGVKAWRVGLEEQGRGQGLKRLKIVHPHHGINCLLLPLYDTSFLKESALKSELSFGKDDDPFLQHITKGKKPGQLYPILTSCLSQDTDDYKGYIQFIKSEIPSDEADEIKEAELQKAKLKQEREKEQKIREQRVKEEREKDRRFKEEKLKKMREEKEKGTRIRRHSSVRAVGRRQQRGLTRTSKGQRSEKKIINIDALLGGEGKKGEEGSPKVTKGEAKIYSVYQKGGRKGKQMNTSKGQKGDQELNERKVWEKQFKQEHIQKEKIKRLLKQTEKKAVQETKQYEEKLKRYEDQVAALRSRIQSSKRRRLPSRERNRINLLKKRNFVESVYVPGSARPGFTPSPSPSPVLTLQNGSALMESRLQEESRAKRSLEVQIKELQKDKLKMEKMMEKETNKASKESEAYRRKIQKYQETIIKMQQNAHESRRSIAQIEKSRVDQEKKNKDILRMYATKEKQLSLKRKLQQKMADREKKRKVREQKRQKERQSLENSRLKSQTSIIEEYQSPTKRSSIASVDTSMLAAKLEEQTKAKQSLEQQIKQLQKDKVKMEKLLQKDNTRASKEGEAYRRKIERYEETIIKMKEEASHNRKSMGDLEKSKAEEERRRIDNVRMYASKEKEEAMRRKIQEKIKDREKRKQEKQLRSNEEKLDKSRKKLERSRSKEDGNDKGVEIIKTKQTIEIVFENRRSKSKKKKREEEEDSLRRSRQEETNASLQRIEKQRELLEKKLQLTAQREEEKQRRGQIRVQQGEKHVERLREQIQKQRERNSKIEESMRQMRKNINSEFELKLYRQRSKYEKEREELMQTISSQKQQQSRKDRFLQEQMKFLQEMETKENELLSILERERNERKAKEILIAQQIQEKERLASQLELQQIKKAIEQQVKEQLRLDESEGEDETEPAFLQKRIQVEKEIAELRDARDQELSELDDQNEKLKELIGRIKGQEQNLLEAIQENIQMESDQEQRAITERERSQAGSRHAQTAGQLESKREKTEGQEDISVVPETLQELQAKNAVLSAELNNKVEFQLNMEEKSKQKYSRIRESKEYKEREKIENLVEMYLKAPQAYPGQTSPKVEDKEKKALAEQMVARTKEARRFEEQLFKSQHALPSHVPKQTDQLDSHLLLLRGAYDEYASDSLRRQLFPPIEDHQGELAPDQLSFEKEEPPMVTLMDDVRAHQRQHSPPKNEKKNFLAINRMRLMVLEDHRKEKQRSIIEEESKKRIQKEIFDKNRKKREKKMQRKREEEQQARAKKYEEDKINDKRKAIRARIQKQLKQGKQPSLEKKRDRSVSDSSYEAPRKRRQRRKKRITSQSSQSQSEKPEKPEKPDLKSEESDSHTQRSDRSETKGRGVLINAMMVVEEQSEKGKSKDQQSQMFEPVVFEQQEPQENKAEQAKKQEEKQTQQAKKQAQEEAIKAKEEAEKKQREELKSDAKSLQSQIREFIAQQEQFQVYQHFVQETQVQKYLQQLQALASAQIAALNSNPTLLQDINNCCSAAILIAKNRKGLEVGVGVFHRQNDTGLFVCDYLLAHDMRNFLNLAFNLTRHLFAGDPVVVKVQFIFDLGGVTDVASLKHFGEFEKKCRRMGEVYLKARSEHQRKYLLSRALFQDVPDTPKQTEKLPLGVEFGLDMTMFDAIMKQVKLGFGHNYDSKISSINVILAYYLSKHQDLLTEFQVKVQHQLEYRQLLVTALLFAKAQINLKSISLTKLQLQQLTKQLSKLKNRMDLTDVKAADKLAVRVKDALSSNTKRCTLEVEHRETDYLVISPDAEIASIQSCNSSQKGFFLSIVPKYKMLVMEAEEFLTMSERNPSLTAFFYIKHFVRNMTEVTKERYQRIFMPEVSQNNQILPEELSEQLRGTIILREQANLGWPQALRNSLILTPTHRDLVIQKPFLLALMTAPIERAVQGSPLFVHLVQ